MSTRFHLAGTVLLLGTLSACAQTALQQQGGLPEERQVELKVEGGILLPPETTPSAGAIQPVRETQEPLEPKAESPVQPEEKTGDVLVMKPGNKEIQGQEGAVSPFDPDAAYLAAISNLIPEKPITIERSEELTVPELLEGLAKFGAFNIAVVDGLEKLKISRVNFPNIPLRDAFLAVLKRYKLNLTRIGDVLWVEGGYKAGDDMVYRIVRLNSISANSLATQLLQILSGGAGAAGSAPPPGGTGAPPAPGVGGITTPNGYFTIHSDSNTIFIRAKPELAEAMAKFITAVDFRGKQVLIEMKVFEVSLDDNTRLGAGLSAADFWTPNNGTMDTLSNFLFTKDPKTVFDSLDTAASPQIGPNSLGDSPAFLLRYQTPKNQVQGFLDFLKTITQLDLVSAPRIVAVNGKTAQIDIIEKIPYIQSSTTSSGGATTTSNTVIFEEVGIKLKVTPTIQEDAHIRLAVEPEVSEEKTKFQGVPVVNKRTSKTEVVVANAETFAIGGLMKTLVSTSEEKVPLLGDIPLVGALFRKTQENRKKLELLILITPRIFENDQEAADLTQQQVETMEKVRKN